MKILYVVPYPPSLVRVRPFQIIRCLTERGHSVTVATVWTDARERSDLDKLTRHTARIIARRLRTWRSVWNAVCALPTTTSLQAVYAWEPGLASEIRELMRTGAYDLVHVEHLRGARYALALLSELNRSARRPLLVWDSVDSISHLFAQATRQTRSLKWRILTRLELPRTRLIERDLARRVDRVLVTSETDRAAFEELLEEGEGMPLGSERLRVVPNGVDTEQFVPGPEARDPDTVILSGKMSYHANATAALHLVREIMPGVWRKRPAARVLIVGQNPPRSVRRLALRDPDRVTVTGAVDDMSLYLRRAQVAVAPILYGAGIQNKVLEAMACETPVVASARAVSALEAVDDRDVLLAETPESFSDAIVSVLDHPQRGRELGRSGRKYVEQHHSWDTIVRDLEAVYLEAVSEMRQSRSDRFGAVVMPSDTARSMQTGRTLPRACKLALDYALAIPILVLLSPVLVLLALLIRLDSPGPVVHRRRVMGVGGRTFVAYKLRTMAADGDEILARHPDLLEDLRRSHKLKNDPRITRIGRWLRRFSLDELPQLYNVVRGEMSLVGPRMISPSEVERYGDASRLLLTVKPGLTGLWQVSGRSDLTYEERVRLDRRYIANYSFRRDLNIFLFRHFQRY